MSQIGKKIIEIPKNATLNLSSDNKFTAKGPLGELSYTIMDGISLVIKDDTITISRKNDDKKYRELHGLTRSLIYNIIVGVCEGYKKELNLVGVGYTADASNKNFLILNLGFSHPIYFEKPDTIEFETPNTTTIIIKGADKQEVGEVSAKIRSLRKPEPYKGKGIKYSDEQVRRKAGKTVGA
jgi:large subunit ribosomal protein L6